MGSVSWRGNGKRHAVRRLTGAALLAGVMLASGCGGMVKPLIVYAPNHGWQPSEEPGKLHNGPDAWGIDHEMYVQVGPPGALLRTWIVEPDDETLRPDGQPRGTIFVLHGFRNQAFWMRDKAHRFAEEGYRAVLVDLRGHGGSSGGFISYGAQESKDLVKVADALKREGLLSGPIGVWGISMGGSTAIQWAGRDERISAVVAVAPFTKMSAIVPVAVRTMLPVGGWFMSDEEIRTIMHQAALEAGFDPAEADALRAIQKTKAPVLILHGTWDAVVPPEHGEQLHEAAPDHSELVQLGWTGHVSAHFNDEALGRAVGWFNEHLAAAMRENAGASGGEADSATGEEAGVSGGAATDGEAGDDRARGGAGPGEASD